MDSSCIPVELICIPADSGLIPADSGLIPAESGHSCRNGRGSDKYWLLLINKVIYTWELIPIPVDSGGHRSI